MKAQKTSYLQQQLETLVDNLGKSWIGDDHIKSKIRDIKNEIERRELREAKTKAHFYFDQPYNGR
jgi:hypothetical protein